MIGIIAAMPKETDSLYAAMTEKRRETIACMDFVCGKLDGIEVAVCTCGPGKVFAAAAAQIMADRFAPSCILNTGIAGTLSPELHIGDIAIADRVMQHDMDTSALGDEIGMVSRVNRVYFDCDWTLVRLAEETVAEEGWHALRGTVASGDQFVSDRKRKAWIADTFGAIACEMEGGAVGQIGFVNGVKFLVLRVISDEADGSATDDYAAFAVAAAEKCVSVVRRMIVKIGEERI